MCLGQDKVHACMGSSHFRIALGVTKDERLPFTQSRKFSLKYCHVEKLHVRDCLTASQQINRFILFIRDINAHSSCRSLRGL
jgi:hypothetical protein